MKVLATLLEKLTQAGRYLRDEVLHVHPSWTGAGGVAAGLPTRYDSSAAWPELPVDFDGLDEEADVPAFNPATGRAMLGRNFDVTGHLCPRRP